MPCYKGGEKEQRGEKNEQHLSVTIHFLFSLLFSVLSSPFSFLSSVVFWSGLTHTHTHTHTTTRSQLCCSVISHHDFLSHSNQWCGVCDDATLPLPLHHPPPTPPPAPAFVALRSLVHTLHLTHFLLPLVVVVAAAVVVPGLKQSR